METRDSEIKIPGKGDIPALDEAAVEKCQSRWLSIAKPLFGLGTLEGCCHADSGYNRHGGRVH